MLVFMLYLQLLTKVFALDRRDAADVSLDDKVEVWDDNEGWCQAGPRVVLHNQVVTLKLPVGVTALLYFGEGVAADSKFTSWIQRVSMLHNIHNNNSYLKSVQSVGRHWNSNKANACLPEDSNEQVDQYYVGEEQVDDKEDDNQPVGEGVQTGLLTGFN